MTKSVFISSTSKDLREHRAAVKDAILRLGLNPIDIQDVQPEGTAGVTLDSANCFMCIVSHQYVPQQEIEYTQAVNANVARFIYIAESKIESPRILLLDDRNNMERLEVFKERISTNEDVKYFSTVESLEKQLTDDLAKFADLRQKSGRSCSFYAAITLIVAVLAAIFAFVVIPGRNVIDKAEYVIDAFFQALPIPTPLEGQPFAQDQVGVVFAAFDRLGEDASDEVENALELRFKQRNLPFVRVNHPLRDRDHAREVADKYNATTTMWGTVSEGGVLLYFEITPRRSEVETSFTELEVTAVESEIVNSFSELEVTAAELESFESYIFEGMDSLYVVDFVQGQIAYFSDDYDTALEDFNRAIGAIEVLPPMRLTALKADVLYFYRGYTNSILGNGAQTMDDYNQTIALNPMFAQAYNNRGAEHSDQGNTLGAIADFDQAIAIDPQDATAHYNRGIAHYDQGDVTDAIADYSRAISLDSQYAKAYNNRGVARYDLEDFAQAIADYNRAIELNPQFAEAYNNRGNARKTQGDIVGAIADYSQAITFNPKFAYAFNNRGVAYHEQGKFEKAIADYDQAIVLNPNFSGAFVNRGNTRKAQGDFVEAIADYDQAIMLEHHFSDAYLGRGNARAKNGDMMGAIDDYSQAISINPMDTLSYYNRGRAWHELGILIRAVSDYTQAITQDSVHIDAYINRGVAQVEMENLVESLADFNRVIELDPNRPEGYFGRGFSYELRGQYAEAIADYREYERLTGTLEPFMIELIAEMEAALAAQTPTP